MKRFSRKMLEKKLIALLKQGISAEQLAIGLAVGITLGLFPLVGTTTIICAVAAPVFRMNFAAVQIGNWAAYPLQLVLLAPFMIAGNDLFGPYAGQADLSMAAAGTLSFQDVMMMLTNAAFHGILVWALCAPLFILVIYRALLHIFRNWMKARES